MSVLEMAKARSNLKKEQTNEQVNLETVVVHEINNYGDAKGRKGTHRVNLVISDKTMDAITVIQDHLEASTTSEAIRRSLMLVYSITEAISNGGQVMIETSNGSRQTLLIA